MTDPAIPAPTPMKKSGAGCVIKGLCVCGGGIVLLVLLAALLLPAVTKSISRGQAASCANNLRQLWTLQQSYTMQFGGPERRLPEETGAAFWLKLTQTHPPLLDETEREVFLCPVKGVSGNPCDYLGPARPASQLQPGDPVGADHPGYHPDGGNVLMKDGRVMEFFDPDFGPYAGKLKP